MKTGFRNARALADITGTPTPQGNKKGPRPKVPNYSLAGSIKALGEASRSGMETVKARETGKRFQTADRYRPRGAHEKVANDRWNKR